MAQRERDQTSLEYLVDLVRYVEFLEDVIQEGGESVDARLKLYGDLGPLNLLRNRAYEGARAAARRTRRLSVHPGHGQLACRPNDGAANGDSYRLQLKPLVNLHFQRVLRPNDIVGK